MEKNFAVGLRSVQTETKELLKKCPSVRTLAQRLRRAAYALHAR